MPFKKGGGHHKGRKSTRISLNVTRTPTPQIQYEDGDADETMVDADDIPAQEDDDAVVSPAAEVDDDEDEEDDEPRITSIPRRRTRGGGRSARTSRAAGTPEVGLDEGSESAGTPMRRKRGRPPGTGGGRGRGGARRGRKAKDEGPSVVIDKEGNRLEVVDDEALVDFDEEGAEKVDELGNLQGGREYRVRTFTILGKGDRLYMLSTEPARCCGFRDSYLFFTKHPKLYKVLLDEEQKKDLIERDVLPNSYKGRNIGVVTARSVFREFGAKIIVGGRRVIDDYKVTEIRENGEVEGEVVDPDDFVPEDRSQYNRNRYVAWFGASEVYRSQGGGATVPGGGKQGVLGKRRNNVTLQNWQFLHAREASRFNNTLKVMREANLNGVYDHNTNMMHYPKIMQPTHAKWEYIPPDDTEDKKPLTNGLANGHTPSDSDHDTVMETSSSQPTIFSKVPPVISRNFTIVDTVYQAPPISNAGYPGPDGHVEDPTSGPNGLSTISQDLVDELPPECRAAFEEARAMEVRWKQGWGTEQHSARRGGLKIGFNGYPV